MKTLKEKFEEKYVVLENGCWKWNGAFSGSKSPRPQMRVNWKGVYATRVGWELTGKVVPEGLLLCHSCDNPLCVNPDHLFLGTQKQNMRDASRKGRFKGKKAIDEEVVYRIKGLRSLGMTHNAIAIFTEYPIGTVGHILAGTRWADDA